MPLTTIRTVPAPVGVIEPAKPIMTPVALDVPTGSAGVLWEIAPPGLDAPLNPLTPDVPLAPD